MTDNIAYRFIRISEVIHMTGLARSTIYSYMQSGDFPASISLGVRSVAWIDSEVRDWMDRQLQKSRAA